MSTEKLFIEVATNPRAWWSKAHSLMSSSAHLYEVYRKAEAEFTERIGHEDDLTTIPREIQLGVQQCAVVVMLMAMAIEDVLKGILIARDQSLIGETKIRSKKTGKKKTGMGFTKKTHDLWCLAKECRISLEYPPQDKLEDLLVRLEAHLKWVGRYPIPVDIGGLDPIPIETANGKEVYGNQSTPISDYYLGQTVFVELIHILEAEPAFMADKSQN